MGLKSKKNLTFCAAENRNRLKQWIIDEKQVYAQKFKQHFNFQIKLIWITTFKRNCCSLSAEAVNCLD